MDLVSSTVALGAAGSGGDPGTYFFTWIGDYNTNSLIGGKCCISPQEDGGFFVTGDANQLTGDGTTVSANRMVIMHIDIDGVYQWGRMIGSNSQYNNIDYAPWDIAADENNNCYAVANVYNYPTTFADCFITKFNSSGTHQWDNRLYTNYNGERFDTIGYDPSTQKVIAVGQNQRQVSSTGQYKPLFVRYNTNGTVDYQKVYTGTNLNIENNRGFVKPNGEVMHTGYDSNSSPSRAVVAKVSNTGAVVWVRAFSSSGFQRGASVTADSSHNVYWGIANSQSDPNASGDDVIMKLTTNGAVTWAKNLTISGMSYGTPTECIAVDDVGNVYFAGYVRFTGDSEDTAVYGKLNSSGVVQYCRKIGPVTNGSFTIRKLIHDQDQSIVFSGNCSDSSGYGGTYVMRLPDDGSITGNIVTSSQGPNQTIPHTSITASVSNNSTSLTALTCSTYSGNMSAGSASRTVFPSISLDSSTKVFT